MNLVTKRLCLFGGYNSNHRIDDYVVYYISELARYADVYFFSADATPEDELKKLDGVVKGRWSERHAKYDFGSWQKLIFRLGWQEIEKYDTLFLVNDSNFGPLIDLGSVLARMEAQSFDAWGITENYGERRHLQSYFLCINRNVIASSAVRDFFESISTENSKRDICLKYEIGFSRMLEENGFQFGTLIDRSKLDVPFEADISAYQNSLLRAGSPFVKRKVFGESGFAEEDITETRAFISKLGYPVDWCSAPIPLMPVSNTKAYGKENNKNLSFNERGRSSGYLVGGIRNHIKRFLFPIYRPVKTRFIDRLVRIEQVYTELDHRVASMETQLNLLVNRFNVNCAEIIECESKDARDIIDKILKNFKKIDEHTSRLSDLQLSVGELHTHIDWVQRDILTAVVSDIKLANSQGFRCVTNHPVAYDSPDHMHPVGTLVDHTRHPRFIRACENYFDKDCGLSFLDLGCSAGGIVLDAVLRGHMGVGLEGSDISKLQQRAEWRLLRDNLFTCDITKPFDLEKGDVRPYKFDVVSAWEVLEHLSSEGVEGAFANIARHTHEGSLFACSISQVDGGFMDDGTPLHQTLEPLEWWCSQAERHGFYRLDSRVFAQLDFARGSGNASIYYKPEHSYREKEGDCLTVVFRKSA
ncbi:rhamnan synthesis F family protein [Brucella sp. 2716]|uniref:rhamnan synthesis F family protein n=1 Tax=Brucella sp. 2716 TaxID=2975052 RepID=UPI00217EE48F|nr:rhamnan synthesis F family protein [Brucella sp. 2716]UWF59415.1 methyltransferase domain-containing protein [Brucella sp. 2716]